MEFALICIGALVILGVIAALASLGKDDDCIQVNDQCASCTSKSDCKLAEIAAKKRSNLKSKAPVSVIILIGFTMLMNVGCSTQKNTAKSRWWHAFNARYNTYYNGTVAYIDGSLEKENGNKDNFTEIIPLYTVGNKSSKELGKGNFDRAIEKAQKAIHQHNIKRKPEWTKNRRKTAKDIEWLSRREYNPFLWKAWMLMGRSQFHQGAFDEAAATFSYMARLYSTQPAILGKARAWLAKCYVENDWLYDAEDVIRNMQRDSMDWRAVKEWDYTYADYYIHTGEYKKAIPYLRKVIKHEMRRKQKAREWYLMGQLLAADGRREEAYKAFRHVVRLNPPYELEFNARISMTEVMAKGKSKQMISKLKRMAASDNNKDYLDQIYYAIGNIYMAEKDTTKAIAAYEKGNEKSVRNGIEKGVLLLHLGDLYWTQEKFSDARRCYGEAIGLLDKDRDDYEQMSERSKVLDELVPYTDAIHLQDSLQQLALMPEEERNAAIDRVIEALKKKEKEERKQQAETELQSRQQSGMSDIEVRGANRPTTPKPQQPSTGGQANATWYFYNPMAVSQGKATFEKQWGKRENIDDWQRSNRTVVSDIGSPDIENMTDEQRDSIMREEAKMDSLEQIADSAQNDPHKREYYLKQIPFTEEQLQASNDILADGLHHAGVIFKDQLDNLPLSEKHLIRVADEHPNYEHMDDVWYHLFLLYSRKGETQQAEAYVDSLKNRYPESQWTTLLTDPYFRENSQFGVHIEDSIYTATYEAFKANRLQEVKAGVALSETRFPMGANRDKFLFIGGLNKLNDNDPEGCLEDMKTLVEKYPSSRLGEMAGMIVNGVKAGKRLHRGGFALGDVWDRRTEVLTNQDSLQARTFSAERIGSFMFLLTYEPDSVNENKLLFEMAKFNFTHFLVRNFEITITEIGGPHQMQIDGFRSYDEAYQYARELYQNKAVAQQLAGIKGIIISKENLELIGTNYSYKDYDDFYSKHFAPLTVTKRYLLSEPAEVAVPEERDLEEEISRKVQTLEDMESGEQYDIPEETGFDIPEESTTTDTPEETNTIETPEDNTTTETPEENTIVVPEENTIVVPEENKISVPEENTIVVPEETNTTVIPEESTIVVPEETTVIENPEETTMEIPTTPAEPTTPSEPTKQTEPVKQAEPVKQVEPVKQAEPIKQVEPQEQPQEDVIYFDDFGDTPTQQNNKKQQQKLDFNIEDEYYDLDGF